MLTDFLITAAFIFGVAADELRNRIRPHYGKPREICQCKHGSAFHDATGCHQRLEKATVTDYDAFGKARAWESSECPCVRYVGPLSSYVPELDGAPAPDRH
jgi:hypothetical protein